MPPLRFLLIVAFACAAVSCGGDDTCVTSESRTTSSGLEVVDLECGDGAEAARGDVVVVHYEGRLEDGSVFSSSREEGEPFEFRIGQGLVIAGWDEGVPGMRVGGRRMLVIPPDLGYGAEGRPPLIPPSATLTFEIELLEVTPAEG